MAQDSVVYDLVLIVHVAVVVLGLAAVCATGWMAALAASSPPGAAKGGPEGPGRQDRAAAVARFFAPRREIAGRLAYLAVPTGLVLAIGSGHAAWLRSSWVVGAGLCWAVSVLVAEAVLWPAAASIRRAIHGGGGSLGSASRAAVAAACGVALLYVAASALMFAQPTRLAI